MHPHTHTNTQLCVDKMWFKFGPCVPFYLCWVVHRSVCTDYQWRWIYPHSVSGACCDVPLQLPSSFGDTHILMRQSGWASWHKKEFMQSKATGRGWQPEAHGPHMVRYSRINDMLLLKLSTLNVTFVVLYATEKSLAWPDDPEVLQKVPDLVVCPGCQNIRC